MGLLHSPHQPSLQKTSSSEEEIKKSDTDVHKQLQFIYLLDYSCKRHHVCTGSAGENKAVCRGGGSLSAVATVTNLSSFKCV